MKKLFALAVVCALCTAPALADWGFWNFDRSWIGIRIKIGTSDTTNWYTLWNGAAGTFHNANLGTLNPNVGDVLQIIAYDTKTWKSGGSDVQQCQYFYTVYEEGNRPGSPTFTSLGGGWLQDLGGGNQKWGNANCNTTNIAALISTVTNRLEVYGQVYGTLPTEWKYDNNNNAPANYNARFVVIPEGGMIGLLASAFGLAVLRKR